jgi:hypothetical protein
MKEIMNDKELMVKIEELTKGYKGDISYFYEAVGMVVVGRLFGWRVIRLVSSGRSWMLACKLFGDLKEVLPERGFYAYKSVGLELIDNLGEYWEVIKRHKTMPMHERRAIE